MAAPAPAIASTVHDHRDECIAAYKDELVVGEQWAVIDAKWCVFSFFAVVLCVCFYVCCVMTVRVCSLCGCGGAFLGHCPLTRTYIGTGSLLGSRTLA